MSKKKKILLIILIISLIAGLIALFVIRRESVDTTTTIAPPSIPVQTTGKYEIETNFKSSFNFPGTLPLMNLERTTLSADNITRIASNLGFSNPIIANDVFDGEIYIYQGNTDGLTVSLKKQSFNYTRNTVPVTVDKQLSNEALVSIAENFLTDNGFLTTNEFQFTSFSYFLDRAGQGLYPVPKEEANLYQLNFSPTLSGIKILTLNPQNTPVYVRILPDGEIHSAQVTKLGKVAESISQYKLKNYDQVVSEINNAILISLDSGNIHLPDIDDNYIKKISLTSAELVYLYDSTKSEYLQPVYLLSGLAEITDSNLTVNASFYLPAIDSN